MKLKLCPWCGEQGFLEREPLWQVNSLKGYIGYVGKYKHYVRCSNSKCGAIAPNGEINDLDCSYDEADHKAMVQWNIRVGEYIESVKKE